MDICLEPVPGYDVHGISLLVQLEVLWRVSWGLDKIHMLITEEAALTFLRVGHNTYHSRMAEMCSELYKPVSHPAAMILVAFTWVIRN